VFKWCAAVRTHIPTRRVIFQFFHDQNGGSSSSTPADAIAPGPS
jgi:hypothetical protein